jgi:hypothetical protein
LLLYVGVCCRVLVGGVFLLSALAKLRSRSAFHEFEMATQSLLRAAPRPAWALAAASIASELLIMVFLAIPQLVIVGFAASCALLVAYSVAIGRALRWGVRTPCRCIGASSDPLHESLLLRNGGLVAACLVGLWGAAAAGTNVEITAALGASVAIAAVVVAIVASFDDLVYLARKSPS